MSNKVDEKDRAIKALLRDIEEDGIIDLQWTPRQVKDARPELVVYSSNSFDRWWGRTKRKYGEYGFLGTTPAIPVQPYAFLHHGEVMMYSGVTVKKRSKTTRIEEFRSTFGTDANICSIIWSKIDPINKVSAASRPIHLLWGLLFIKQYNSENVNKIIARVSDRTTFRDWSWKFVVEMARLHGSVVSIFSRPF